MELGSRRAGSIKQLGKEILTSSSLGLRVLGEIPIFSRSIGRYLPIDRSHLRKSLRAQLALFVDVTRAGRGIARFDVGAAELPYLTNEA